MVPRGVLQRANKRLEPLVHELVPTDRFRGSGAASTVTRPGWQCSGVHCGRLLASQRGRLNPHLDIVQLLMKV
jgi:hypothetical protein